MISTFAQTLPLGNIIGVYPLSACEKLLIISLKRFFGKTVPSKNDGRNFDPHPGLPAKIFRFEDTEHRLGHLLVPVA